VNLEGRRLCGAPFHHVIFLNEQRWIYHFSAAAQMMSCRIIIFCSRSNDELQNNHFSAASPDLFE